MPQSELHKKIEEIGVADFDAGLCTQLCDCITRRVEIEFLYEDDPYFICRPHVLFVSPDNVLLLEGFRPGMLSVHKECQHFLAFLDHSEAFQPGDALVFAFLLAFGNPSVAMSRNDHQNVGFRHLLQALFERGPVPGRSSL